MRHDPAPARLQVRRAIEKAATQAAARRRVPTVRDCALATGAANPRRSVLTVSGAVTEAFDMPLATLATPPHLELTANFHCMVGWSPTDLRWDGVPFEGFYRAIIEPAQEPAVEITHIVFRGLDRDRSVVLIEDAMAEGVLLADRLAGRPLGGDYGVPVRLVSPA